MIGRMEKVMEISSMRLSETQRVELYTLEGKSYVILSDSVVEEYVMRPVVALALLKWLVGAKEELEQLAKNDP
jgi:hypothetical protein